MTSSIHAILSDLHRMLSAYDEQDFLAAARHRGTHPTLKDALTALAKEARVSSGNKGLERNSQKQINGSRPSSSKPVKKRSEFSLEELLMRSSISASSAQMADFARRHAIDVSLKPKESRERLARRIAAAMASLNDDALSSAIDEMNATASSQTQGWIDVLRKRRR